MLKFFSIFFFNNNNERLLRNEYSVLSRVHMNDICRREVRQIHGTFVHHSAFSKAANRPYIDVLYANSL